jgi:hypothetical protein
VKVAVTALFSLAACTDPVSLPAPTGPLPIGETVVRLVDPSRSEEMTDEAGDDRELTIHLFYPADPSGDGNPAPYVPDRKDLRKVLDHHEERLFRLVEGHAVLDAPVRAGADPLPVVVFSHGDDRIGAEYGFLVEDLVSHGFAVAAIDHPYDARAVLLESGKGAEYAEDAWPPRPPQPADGTPDPDSAYATFYRHRVEVRSADASFALDSLTAADPTAALGSGESRLALDRVAFVGHSVGGVAAGQFCQDDPRAAACVNLDGDSGSGPFYLEEDGSSFDAPYLMLTKPFDVPDEQLADWGMTRAGWDALVAEQRESFFGGVAGGSWRVAIEGGTHDSFSDEPYVLAQLEGTGDAAQHLARMGIIREWVRSFVDRFVLGVDAPLLDAEPGAGVSVEVWPASEASR